MVSQLMMRDTMRKSWERSKQELALVCAGQLLERNYWALRLRLAL